ncbi:Atg16p SCDLUD_002659 [Saccharomycodes ludwigii]|uniref:Atg16p n=1 Tax=Saccharomycodes ludwigii TaxID=36035 RepID=UPI001E8B3FAF|nr:hypothetical protein SCDLUD_002659 [Saccharomycodes ludwigii]KAH3901176.1 hypothetical protein SCDLUD_002659 [Saccharomycodes ludwigii]
MSESNINDNAAVDLEVSPKTKFHDNSSNKSVRKSESITESFLLDNDGNNNIVKNGTTMDSDNKDTTDLSALSKLINSESNNENSSISASDSNISHRFTRIEKDTQQDDLSESGDDNSFGNAIAPNTIITNIITNNNNDSTNNFETSDQQRSLAPTPSTVMNERNDDNIKSDNDWKSCASSIPFTTEGFPRIAKNSVNESVHNSVNIISENDDKIPITNEIDYKFINLLKARDLIEKNWDNLFAKPKNYRVCQDIINCGMSNDMDTSTNNTEQLTKLVDTCKEELLDKEREIRNLTEIMVVNKKNSNKLHDEIVSLTIENNLLQQELDKSKKDYEALVVRWMAKAQQQADLMNHSLGV